MSTGNNIIISITDQVDASIQAKIAGIGTAARQASNDLATLQGQMKNLTGGTTGLSQALAVLPGQQNAATAGTGRLTGAFAQLIGRVAGAEAGVGMLGGAFARVGVAAGLAGPLIVAGLAVAAVVGAILIYNDFEKQALALSEAQGKVAETNQELTDKLLTQQEVLAGIVGGPLGKYEKELADLSFKNIKVNFEDINKLMKTQSGWLDTLLSNWDRFTKIDIKTGNFTPGKADALSTLPKFEADEERKRELGKDTTDLTKKQMDDLAAAAKAHAESEVQNNQNALAHEIQDYTVHIEQIKTLIGSQDQVTRTQSLKALDDAQQMQGRLLTSWAELENAKTIITAEAIKARGKLTNKDAVEQLREFNEEISLMKDSGKIVTAKDERDLREKQLSGDTTGRDVAGTLAAKPPLNADVTKVLEKDIGAKTQDILKDVAAINELIAKTQLAGQAAAAYSIELKQEAANALIWAEQKKAHPMITDNELQKLYDAKDAEIALADQNKELANVYAGSLTVALLHYNATLAATSIALKDHAITSEEASRADIKAAKALADSVDPLNQYKLGLASEIRLIGQYGTALKVATDVENIRLQLAAKDIIMTSQQKDAWSSYLTILEKMKDVQADINALQQANAGTVEKLTNQQIALNSAVGKGIISESQYKIQTNQVNVALANQALESGKNITSSTQLTSVLGKLTADYKGVAVGITDAYGKAAQQAVDGFSNSLARAIVYGENLGDAMAAVARTIATDLISAFIKLALQWVINEILGKTIAATSTATSVALAGTLATAWATPAMLADIATFGGASVSGDSALISSLAIAQGLALAGGKAGGGYISGVGTSTSDSILARLSNGEFVVKASQVQKNRALLESINSGAASIGANSKASVGNAPGTTMNVSVSHDGSTAVKVQRIDENTVRIIAKQEAESAVNAKAPGVIAADLQNPNSRTSKAVNNNIVAPRKR